MKKTMKQQMLTAAVVLSLAGVLGGVQAEAAIVNGKDVPDNVVTDDFINNTASSAKFVIGQGAVSIQTDANLGTMAKKYQIAKNEGKSTLNAISYALNPSAEFNKDVPLIGVAGGEGQLDDGFVSLLGNSKIQAVLSKDQKDNVKKFLKLDTTGLETNVSKSQDIHVTVGSNDANDSHSPVVLGAVGGDLSINSGLDGEIKTTTFGKETIDSFTKQNSSIYRKGTVSLDVKNGNVLGGIGGSLSIASGKIVANGYSNKYNLIIVDTKLTFDGKTDTAIEGNIVTNVNGNANVSMFANGGGAIALGGTATSTVNGSTTFKADSNVILTEQTKDGITVGVSGGGLAASTLGGEATSTVGSTTVSINNGISTGLFGGGVAASVDATGLVEKVISKNPDRFQNAGIGAEIGDDDGSADITDTQLEKLLNKSSIPNLTITAKRAIDGGNANSIVKGKTDIAITGNTLVFGVAGGGAAVAYHSHQWRADGTGSTKDTTKFNKGDAFGTSNAEATTGETHILVKNKDHINLQKVADGAKKILASAKAVIDPNVQFKMPDVSMMAGNSGAVGLLGGGVAFSYGNKSADLHDKKGATATATTAGATIDLEEGYAAGVFAGGGAATVNNAKANSTITGEAKINVSDGMHAIALYGGGVALSMEHGDGNGKVDGMLATSHVVQSTITTSGDVEGIYGGGMAVGNSYRGRMDGSEGEVPDALAAVGTSNIIVNGGTVSNMNLETLTEAADGGALLGQNAKDAMADLQTITHETSIAAGGMGMGMTGLATVKSANITINGGTIEKDILGGGIAIDNHKKGAGATVGTTNIVISNAKTNGSIYAGGASNHTKRVTDTATVSKVDTANITLEGTNVTGEISGLGYKIENNQKVLAENSVGESHLTLAGANTLSALSNTGGYTSASKVHDFKIVTAKAGSVTKVEGLTAGNIKALIDAKDGKVTVEEGTSLDISAFKKSTDKYYVAGGYANGSTFWDDDDLFYDRFKFFAEATDTNGRYEISFNDITADNVDKAIDTFAARLGADWTKPLIERGLKPGFGDYTGAKAFFNDWNQNRDTYHDAYNRAGLIGEDTAVTGNTVSIARDMADNVVQRLSFTDDFIQSEGWTNENGGLWAKYVHKKYEADGLSSTVGGLKASSDYDGAIVGMDFAKKGKLQYGAAFHYGTGEGHGLISSNDYDAWGLTVYGALKDEAAHTNLMADLGYAKTSNDITGHVNGKSLTASRDVDVWTLGVRGEKEYISGANQIVPYAGLRYLHVAPARYTSYYDGQKAFDYDAENQDLWLLPVGVSFRNETVMASGWKITPKVDLSYIWAFGDTDTHTNIWMNGGVSSLAYTVMDDSWLASVGVEAQKNVWSYGVGYSYQKGDDTKDTKWYVNLSYAF